MRVTCIANLILPDSTAITTQPEITRLLVTSYPHHPVLPSKVRFPAVTKGFLSPKTSRPAPGPTLPLSQRVQGVLSPGGKAKEAWCWAFHTAPWLRRVQLYMTSRPAHGQLYQHENRPLVYSASSLVHSSWNVMAHGNAREGKWRGNWRMEWVANTLHTTSDTWCIQHYYRWCAHLGCQQSTELTPPPI